MFVKTFQVKILNSAGILEFTSSCLLQFMCLIIEKNFQNYLKGDSKKLLDTFKFVFKILLLLILI